MKIFAYYRCIFELFFRSCRPIILHRSERILMEKIIKENSFLLICVVEEHNDQFPLNKSNVCPIHFLVLLYSHCSSSMKKQIDDYRLVLIWLIKMTEKLASIYNDDMNHNHLTSTRTTEIDPYFFEMTIILSQMDTFILVVTTDSNNVWLFIVAEIIT